MSHKVPLKYKTPNQTYGRGLRVEFQGGYRWGEVKRTCDFRSHSKTFHVEHLYIPFEITFCNELANLGNTQENPRIPLNC
jgi:hypothetical protein